MIRGQRGALAVRVIRRCADPGSSTAHIMDERLDERLDVNLYLRAISELHNPVPTYSTYPYVIRNDLLKFMNNSRKTSTGRIPLILVEKIRANPEWLSLVTSFSTGLSKQFSPGVILSADLQLDPGEKVQIYRAEGKGDESNWTFYLTTMDLLPKENPRGGALVSRIIFGDCTQRILIGTSTIKRAGRLPQIFSQALQKYGTRQRYRDFGIYSM